MAADPSGARVRAGRCAFRGGGPGPSGVPERPPDGDVGARWRPDRDAGRECGADAPCRAHPGAGAGRREDDDPARTYERHEPVPTREREACGRPAHPARRQPPVRPRRAQGTQRGLEFAHVLLRSEEQSLRRRARAAHAAVHRSGRRREPDHRHARAASRGGPSPAHRAHLAQRPPRRPRGVRAAAHALHPRVLGVAGVAVRREPAGRARRGAGRRPLRGGRAEVRRAPRRTARGGRLGHRRPAA